MVDANQIELDCPACCYWPEFGASGKQEVTVRHLLAHSSGLPAFRPFFESCSSKDEVLSRVSAEPIVDAPGSQTVYSDIGMIALGHVLERVGGETLHELTQAHVSLPLKLPSTGFLPEVASQCAPTEFTESWRLALRLHRKQNWSSDLIQGEVHDPNAAAMGGVSGHAGLFATLPDVTRFCGYLLRRFEGYISSATTQEFLRPTRIGSGRVLGYSLPNPDDRTFSKGSIGHTGFTGTSIWVDYERQVGVVLLTNRVHPTADNTKIIGFRSQFHDLIVKD
jgi:CubicO group peptidase (beta-lactamase class C family)